MVITERLSARKNIGFTPEERDELNRFCRKRKVQANVLIRKLVLEYMARAKRD